MSGLVYVGPWIQTWTFWTFYGSAKDKIMDDEDVVVGIMSGDVIASEDMEGKLYVCMYGAWGEWTEYEMIYRLISWIEYYSGDVFLFRRLRCIELNTKLILCNMRWVICGTRRVGR